MIDGYLSASFDLLNVADLDVIDQARAQCDQLTVGVFSDEYVERTMGRKPVIALEERLALLRHVRGVDHVVVHDDVDLALLSAERTVFAVDGVHYGDQKDGLRRPETVWLSPARRTESDALRRSLARQTSAGQSAVA